MTRNSANILILGGFIFQYIPPLGSVLFQGCFPYACASFKTWNSSLYFQQTAESQSCIQLWKRHRSHHIQNVFPNVIAGHQLLDTTQALGTFPITKISPGTFKSSKQAALVLLFRWKWIIKVTEAAPVCLSQKLVSLFHLLPVVIPIPEVVVGLVLIVFRHL